MRTTPCTWLFALLPCLLLLPVEARAATTTEHSLLHQGRQRMYRLITPSGHAKTKPVPLVLALHGGGGEAKQFDASTSGQFRREADKRGWVVVFPQGIAKGWNDGRPLVTRRARQRKGVDDVAFLSAVIDQVQASHGIDRSRVYATGISNGGFMSIRLGLELAPRIAAIAPVTAQLQKAHASKRPAQPVGLMVINGTSDPLVPYAGGHVTVFGRKHGAIFSTDETIVRWRAFNTCQKDVKAAPLPDKAPRDGTKTTVTRYTPCRSGAEVVLVRVEGGGHAWPGGTQYLPQRLVGRASRDFDAVPLIFDFFARHRRGPVTPAPVRPPQKK